VIGSGLGRKGSSVRWRTAGRIGLGWLMTLPASAVVGALAALVAGLGPIGLGIDLVVGLAIIVTIFLISRRSTVDAGNAISEVDAAAIAVRTPKATRRKRKAAR
jgi:PiT family inorganic phosphate transporter